MTGNDRVGGLSRRIELGIAAVLFLCATPIARSTPSPQASKPRIITKSLPNAKEGRDYVKVIEAMGGKVPWNFSVTDAPAGISLDTVRGPNTTDTLHGVPTETGDFNVKITVTDSSEPPQSSSITLKLHVDPK
jgi:hypothetical protein